jgi:hypothetical protein
MNDARRRAQRLGWVALAVIGCDRAPGTSDARGAPDASSPPPTSPPSSAPTPRTTSLELAARAMARSPSAARFVSRPTWSTPDGAFTIRSSAFEARAPRHLAAPFEVHVGELAGVALTPLLAAGGQDVAATDEGDALVFADALPGGDAVALAGEEALELAYVLRRAPADPHARYRFALQALDGATAREDGRGGIDVLDRRGTVRLRLPTPLAIDDAGTRREGRARLDGTTLEIDLDLAGLQAPIVIDPGFESATWVTQTPATVPFSVYGHGLVYDPNRDRTVLFTGCNNYVGWTTAEVWEWNHGTKDWTRRSDAPMPAAVCLFASTWDSSRGAIVAFGAGWPGGTYEPRTFEYDGRGWTARALTPAPTPRIRPALAFDAKRGVTVLFGGTGHSPAATDPEIALNDTWEYDGAWKLRIASGTAGSPSIRGGAALGFDPVRGVIVLYGGHDLGGTIRNDTWEYDGTAWKQASPLASPPALTNATMVWDSVAKRLVLAGGTSSSMYGYDGRTWTALATTGYLRRGLSQIAFDSKHSTFVVFGGEKSLAAVSGFSDPIGDTQTWTESACVTGADCGGGSCVGGLCCSTACTGACQTCAPAGTCGTLATGTASPDPSCPYLCKGGPDCPTSCAADGDCAPGAACTGGTCVPKRPIGASCGAAGQCLSGACVDGFCCDRACGGACEACDVAGSAGHCGPIAKNATPHGTRAGCAGAGSCAGACDGASSQCQFPGGSVVCAAARCAAGLATSEARCDGVGNCPAVAKITCAPFACGPTACNAGCTTDAECATTAYCTSGRCAPKVGNGGTCDVDAACASGTCSAGLCAGPIDAGSDVAETAADTGAAPDSAVAAEAAPDTAVAAEAAPDTATAADTAASAEAAPDTAASAEAAADTATAPDTAASAETSADALADAPATDGAPPQGWPAPGEPPKATGTLQSCRFDSECAAGFCVDGVCCNSRCDQPCHSCALLTAPGKCQPEPYGVDLRQECGRPMQCIGTCAGNGQCIGAGPGTLCSRNRCVSPTAGVGAAYCTAPGVPCPSDEVVAFDCAPFACEPAVGACKTTCATSDDCAPGSSCDATTRVCAPTPPAAGDGGGGCAMGAHGAGETAIVSALVGLVLASRRRRRSVV